MGGGAVVMGSVVVVGALASVAMLTWMGSALVGEEQEASTGGSVAGSVAVSLLLGGSLVGGAVLAGSSASGYSKAAKCRDQLEARERIRQELGLVPAPGGGWMVTKPSPLLDRLPPKAPAAPVTEPVAPAPTPPAVEAPAPASPR